jgi:hypothetical protein
LWEVAQTVRPVWLSVGSLHRSLPAHLLVFAFSFLYWPPICPVYNLSGRQIAWRTLSGSIDAYNIRRVQGRSASRTLLARNDSRVSRVENHLGFNGVRAHRTVHRGIRFSRTCRRLRFHCYSRHLLAPPIATDASGGPKDANNWLRFLNKFGAYTYSDRSCEKGRDAIISLPKLRATEGRNGISPPSLGLGPPACAPFDAVEAKSEIVPHRNNRPGRQEA